MLSYRSTCEAPGMISSSLLSPAMHGYMTELTKVGNTAVEKSVEGGVTTIHYGNIIHYCRISDRTQFSGVATEHMLVYICSGELKVTVNGRDRILGRGDAYILRRNRMCRKTSSAMPDGEPFEGIFLYLSAPVLRRTMSQNSISINASTTYPVTTPYIPLPRHPYLDDLFASLITYFRAEKFPGERLMELKMQEAVLTLLEIDPDLAPMLFDFVAPAKIDLRLFMEQYYTQDIDLAGLAHYAGRSLSAFKQEFSDTFGMSPRRWIIRRRLDDAYRRIAQGGRPAEVCAKVGFKSLSHFSRAFKRQFGVPPSHVYPRQ